MTTAKSKIDGVHPAAQTSDERTTPEKTLNGENHTSVV